MKYSEYSVVIVGSGAAGLYSALKISQNINTPDGVLIITKDTLGESNSKYAQGGIVGVVHQNPEDNIESHVNDTLNAGAGLCTNEVVEYISRTSDEVINDLINLGIKFDKDNNGKITFTLEAAHSINRILHAGGDATGKCIVNGLKKKVLEDSNISIMENAIAVELLVTKQNECKGLILFNDLTQEHEIVYSSSIVLASGGFGQVYKYTTNPEGATGDGIDLAYNAGADIQDMEFVQFHPTALAKSPDDKNRFLISEAVRGEGAKLINTKGNEFMKNYHDKRELAPRDIVTRAIFNEMSENNVFNVFLNASIIDNKKLSSRFPTIINRCKEKGIDITNNPIPVAPAAHYSMGGIKATVEGKTSIKGLYAIGECSSTGLHGANRLASNSLLECVVCAYELADYLSFANLEVPKKIDDKIRETIKLYSLPINENIYDISKLNQELKDLMWNNVGIIRNEAKLKDALLKIKKMTNNFKRNRKCHNREEYEYRNLLTIAYLITNSAILRKESRGGHYREDYNRTSINAVHSNMNINNKEKELIEC